MTGGETLQSVCLLCPQQPKIVSINFTNPASDQLPQMLALNCTFNVTVVLCAGMELQEPKTKELECCFLLRFLRQSRFLPLVNGCPHVLGYDPLPLSSKPARCNLSGLLLLNLFCLNTARNISPLRISHL